MLRHVLGYGILACCIGAGTAYAQSYPERPIRLIVPYAAGGASDIIARQFGRALGEELGQTVIVENKPGAAASIGTAFVARAPSDGYTLLLADTPHVINPAVLKTLPYDPIDDFSAVGTVGRTPLILLANPELPLQNMQEMVEQVKAKPEDFNIASGGTGTLTHMTGVLMQEAIGLDMQHIPYNGTGQALGDVVAGHVDIMVSTAPGAIPLVKANSLRALAITGVNRIDALPEVPTFSEQGVSNFNEFTWYGLLAPAGLTAQVQDVLSRGIQKALGNAELNVAFKQAEVTPYMLSPDDFSELLKKDLQKWQAVVERHNIKAD